MREYTYALHLVRCIPTAPYYLIYFDEDETVAVVSASAISEAGLSLEVGGSCYVREKGKMYEGRIITYGEYCG